MFNNTLSHQKWALDALSACKMPKRPHQTWMHHKDGPHMQNGMFNSQSDFTLQKSHFKEYVTSWGHICDFYPKFHCKLNFIEQYWDVAKFWYRSSQCTCNMEAMERNVIECINDIPLLQIQRFLSFFHWPYLAVVHMIHNFHNTDTQIILCASFPLMHKVWLVVRQPGPTTNTMVIVLYLPLWFLKWRRHSGKPNNVQMVSSLQTTDIIFIIFHNN